MSIVRWDEGWLESVGRLSSAKLPGRERPDKFVWRGSRVDSQFEKRKMTMSSKQSALNAASPALRRLVEAVEPETKPNVKSSRVEVADDEAPPVEAVAPASLVTYHEACALDSAKFCKDETRVLTLVQQLLDEVEASTIDKALRRMDNCMAEHATSLTPTCLQALVANFVRENSAIPEKTPAKEEIDDHADDASVEIQIFYTRHAVGNHVRSMPPVAVTATAAPDALQYRVNANATTSSGVDLSFLWVLFLPFVCIGMYVSYNYVLVYLRRRRDVLRVECKQYTPVN